MIDSLIRSTQWYHTGFQSFYFLGYRFYHLECHSYHLIQAVTSVILETDNAYSEHLVALDF